MKDTGKSSSRKLRRDVYYILYRMDPQKTHYKISCSATISNIQHFGFFFRFPPLTPIALRRALFIRVKVREATPFCNPLDASSKLAWLAGLLAGWLACWLAGWLACWLASLWVP